MFNIAYAMGQGGAAEGGGGAFAGFIPLILMFVIFYFLLIRPQQKRQKEHKAMLEALQRGDDDGVDQRGDHPDGRRLARPIGPQKAKNSAGWHLK